MVEFLGFKISFIAIAVLASLWGVLVGLFIVSLTKRENENNIIDRLNMDDARQYIREKGSYKTSYGRFYNKNISHLFKEDSLFGKIASALVPNTRDIERKLSLINSDITVEEFVSIKVLSLVIGVLMVIIGFIANMNYVVIGVGALLAIISMGLEEQVYGEKIKKRNIEMERGLPNFLDLLYSACKSGHTVTEGIIKVSSKYNGVVADEFNKAMVEFKGNGGNFKAAMEHLMDRNDIDALSNVVSDILIAYEKGDAQIVNTIKQEAVSMREIVNAQIEEQANKKATGLLIPMMIFFFMPLLAFILIPMLSQFVTMMK